MRGILFRRSLLLVLAVLALAGCGESRRPNVLLIIIDTARGDRFPFGGYARPTAPNLEVVAREGAVYTQAYSPAPWTVPAHASLFTGQYPSLHRTDCGSLRLPDQAITLAETLRDAGYRTVGYTANPWLGREYNFQQGRFLEWRAGNADALRQPFFLFINYFEPHLPYHPPEPERSRFLRQGVAPERIQRLSHLGHPDEMRYIVGLSDLTDDDLAILNDLYDGEIAYADRRAGEVLDLLRRQGLLDRTIVAVAGDHGENIGDHHMMDHKLSVHAGDRPPRRRAPGRRPDHRGVRRSADRLHQDHAGPVPAARPVALRPDPDRPAPGRLEDPVGVRRTPRPLSRRGRSRRKDRLGRPRSRSVEGHDATGAGLAAPPRPPRRPSSEGGHASAAARSLTPRPGAGL